MVLNLYSYEKNHSRLGLWGCYCGFLLTRKSDTTWYTDNRNLSEHMHLIAQTYSMTTRNATLPWLLSWMLLLLALLGQWKANKVPIVPGCFLLSLNVVQTKHSLSVSLSYCSRQDARHYQSTLSTLVLAWRPRPKVTGKAERNDSRNISILQGITI